jgi:hypothetical protein
MRATSKTLAAEQNFYRQTLKFFSEFRYKLNLIAHSTIRLRHGLPICQTTPGSLRQLIP